MPEDSPSLHSPQPQRLDMFSGQKNSKVLKLIKKMDITAVYIPDGCTEYIQPMDTIINKLVKDKIGDILEETLTPSNCNYTCSCSCLAMASPI